MAQAKVAEAWKNYPLQTKLKGKAYTLRPMTLDDGERLQRFARELPPHDLLFLRRDITKPEGIKRWMDAVERGAMYTILCEDEQGIVAYSSLHLTELDWSKHVADLRVATAERARGAGLGRLMTREAFNMALALGIEKVVARMTPDQQGARALFQELGFTDPIFRLEGWMPMAAPAGTPEEILRKVADAVVEGYSTPKLKQLHETFGITNGPPGLDETRRRWKDEGPQWIAAADRLGVKLD